MKDAQIYKIPYWISNQGDGSVALRLCKSKEEADRCDKEQMESSDGWAESCSGEIEIAIRNGQLFIRDGYTKVKGKLTPVWTAIQ